VLRKLQALATARAEAAAKRQALKAARERKLKLEAVARKQGAHRDLRKPNRPIVLTAPLSVAAETPGLHIFDLREGHCRWPLGTDRPARLFCGCTAVRGTSWCEAHERVAYGRPQADRVTPKHAEQKAKRQLSASSLMV